jgi:hypothetical protein
MTSTSDLPDESSPEVAFFQLFVVVKAFRFVDYRSVIVIRITDSI